MLITDGRYIKLAQSNPAEAAEKLGYHLSPRAVEALQGILGRAGGGPVSDGPVAIAVTVVIVVVVLARDPDMEVVVDSSGLVKI